MDGGEFGSDMNGDEGDDSGVDLGDTSNDVSAYSHGEAVAEAGEADEASSEVGNEAAAEIDVDTPADDSFESDLSADVEGDETVTEMDVDTPADDSFESDLSADVEADEVDSFDDDGDSKAALEEYGYDTSDYGRGNKGFDAKSVAELTDETSSSKAAETMHAARDDAEASGDLTRGSEPGEEHPSPEEIEAYSLDSLRDLAFQLDEVADQDDDSTE